MRTRLARDFLGEADLRAIMHLLGEATRLTGDRFARKCYVLDGLCNFTGSDEWRWAVYRPGSEASPLLAWRREFQGVFPPVLSVRSRQESSVTEPAALPPAAGTGQVIVSTHALEHGRESRVALCRTREGRPSYTPREVHFAALILDEVAWLHQPDEPPPLPPATARLSPRQQDVFDLLRKGFGRKEIADRLGIAAGTVCGYIRELYRCFHVTSHAALMGRPLPGPESFRTHDEGSFSHGQSGPEAGRGRGARNRPAAG